MTNLFSTFDPSTSYYFNWNWLSMSTPFMLLPLNYFLIPSRYQMSFHNMKNFIIKEMKNNLNKTNFMSTIFFTMIFFNLMINNLIGLHPYIFTATSHLVISLSLALPIWMSIMIYGWIKTTNHMFTHLVPMGSPMMLSSFMVLIETISNLIRPLTLSVRLSANMIAGHLLISLLSGISESLPSMYFPSSLILMTLLSLEYAVAMIQSYVFITLLTLYLNEIN
uniref:ATP synthase subunit a n=1 Tax=Stylochyrus rarior TaxID=679428 RepID=D0UY34_STYRA|nr:ATP synthase F0 subunit 6 [Stylochyrus rarior]ACY35978.1 ATP synthase F0 subunit 6 [Stylochyrus rarior]